MRQFFIIVIFVSAATAFGCKDSNSKPAHTAHSDKTPVAEVHHPRTELELTTVSLSESARAHLDIQTAPVRRVSVPRTRIYGGDIVIPEGRTIVISSPLAGTIKANKGGGFPKAGNRIAGGETLFALDPSIRGDSEILNPSDRIALARARADLEAARVQAAGDVESAKVRVEGTRIALGRAEKLVSQNAGSVRSLDEAKADHQLAQTSLEAAEARQKVLDETIAYLSGEDRGSSLNINAPFGGTIQRLLVAPNEAIAANAQLCEIVALDTLWVRVSVYVGDLPSLSLLEHAVARLLGAKSGEQLSITAVAAPPTANATSSTVDVYFSLDNSTGNHQPGERLIVSVPTKDAADALVIPKTAILYDIHGDAWAYVSAGDNAYSRRRVVVDRIHDDDAILDSGLAEEVQVVVEGAAELFGIEFGTSGH